VTFTAAGVEYALNDAATRSGHFRTPAPTLRKRSTGYVEIGDERHPVYSGPSIKPMLSRGLDLCS
jgi:hypothetical protein